MNYIKKYNTFESFLTNSREPQLVNADIARNVVSKIYKIEDEYSMGSLVDFLVDTDKFLEYAFKHNGSLAGNFFDSLDHLTEVLDKIKEISKVERIFVAPHWFSRTESDIIKFGDVYSDTLYIKMENGFPETYMSSRKRILAPEDKIILFEIKEITNGDEVDVVTSINGNSYIRVWWD